MKSNTLSRYGVLLYGSAVYLLFLATFLYLVGFVSGRLVPRSVNDGPEGSALLVNGALLALFAVQHMVMARPGFKRAWTRLIHAAAERSTFVLLTLGCLWLIFTQWRTLPGVVWSVGGPGAVVLEALSFAGWGVVLLATFLIDHFDLFGIKQVVRHFRGKPEQSPAFLVRSLYRHTRHPLYLGFLVAFWCAPTMTISRLIFAAGFTFFILIAVRLEERDLLRAHGHRYADYRRRVPMILPSIASKYS